ncbi:MAG: c-type cytochrome [Alphaproteobacteria bacterium]
MSSLDINKFVGAILFTLLLIWITGMIADALVDPGKVHGPAMVADSGKAPAAKAKAKAKAPKLAAIGPLLAKASAADGKKVAKKCKACHAVTKGGKNKVGPTLWNMVNAPKAGNAGFKYSKALKGKGGKWTYEDLNAFLASPKGFAKGTKMSFPGIKKAGDRAALIKYLRSLSASPAPLP